MEIRPPNQNTLQKNIGTIKKEKKTGGSSFSNALDDKAQISVQASAYVFRIDPLFTNFDEPSPKQAGIQAGLSLLDELEKLRAQLLSGSISSEIIITIQNQIKGIKDHLNEKATEHTNTTLPIDDTLREMLLEIETRAVVELAKLKVRQL